VATNFDAGHIFIRKTPLPDFRRESQLLFRSIGEPTLDELHRSLHRHPRRQGNQQMDVVRHHHKLVEPISPLLPIRVQHLHQQAGHSFRLKQAASFPGGGGDEERTGRLGGLDDDLSGRVGLAIGSASG